MQCPFLLMQGLPIAQKEGLGGIGEGGGGDSRLASSSQMNLYVDIKTIGSQRGESQKSGTSTFYLTAGASDHSMRTWPTRDTP